ncbi:MAG TPA: RHS repeat-associated core domain-containing protein [Pyrinomonadaceae bacterium]|nr:RHS repeat-associated core domain-containing protein [Pyrinomonadaceae bacterium]
MRTATGAWSSSAVNNFPESVQVDFGANKTINEIDVFTLQDNWAASTEPTEAMTFTLYGLTGYDVQYWTGSSWVTVPGGSVTGNNKIWRTFTFSPISTSKIRVLTNASPDGASRVTEIEAYGPADAGGSSAVHWLVADHLGTPRIIFDQSGDLANVRRHDYAPFGEELLTAGGRASDPAYGGGDSVRQHFTSKERDAETGLDYFGARYLSSAQGRFTGVDPGNYQAWLDLTDAQSWNAYSYVNNNPLRRVDHDGRGFFSKLKNWLAYDVWGEEDDVKREEDRRREMLLNKQKESGGVLIIENLGGDLVQVDPANMTRAHVFFWSNRLMDIYEQGGRDRPWRPDDIVHAGNSLQGLPKPNGTQQPTVYRGGSDIAVKPNEVKIKDGMVQTTRGPSLNTDPAKVRKFGGAYKVENLPDELQIIQRGRDPGHFEIVPRSPCPLTSLLN